MNWDAISAVGQMIGAIGVMASLVYLAIQIRTNSEDVRDNTTFRVVQMLLESRRDLVYAVELPASSTLLAIQLVGQAGQIDARRRTP